MHCTIFHPLKNGGSFRKEFWFLVEVVTFRSKNSSSTCMEGGVSIFFVYSRVTVEFLLSYKSAATLRRFY